MSRCTVTLSANAGLALDFGGVRILVDALHTAPVAGFSSLTPPLLEQLWAHGAFSAPDGVFFTHCHPDHFSQDLAAEAAVRWPRARLILPERRLDGQHLLSGDTVRMELRRLSLRFFRLPHEGARYADVPHYGLLVSDGVFRILLPGDCALASPALARHLAGETVDLAVVNFPWLTLRRGRDFIRDVLRAKRLLVCHLPFEADDVNAYRSAARRSLPLAEIPDVRLLTQPFQQEAFSFLK